MELKVELSARGRVETMASDEGINNFLKEWESTRAVLKEFDDRLHDLRKYGFSFITAFLTASTILFQNWIIAPNPPAFEGQPFPEPIKATILGVTILLIFGIYIMDRNYLVYQKAANARAMVLERILNIELSDGIIQRFRMAWIHISVTVIYLFFIVGVLLLGSAVLSSSLNYLYLSGSIIAILVIVLSRDFVLLHYRYGMMDWILDRLECKQGDEVRIIMTNISDKVLPKRDYPIAEGEVMWKLVKEGEEETLLSGVASKNFCFAPYHNYTWVLKTTKDGNGVKNLEPGIYRINRRTWNRKGKLISEVKMKPLSRKLRIISRPPDSSPKPSVHNVNLKRISNNEDFPAS